MELQPKPKPPTPSLRKNVAWYFAGNTILAVSQFGMFLLLARQTSELEVGQLALALAVTTPLFTLANLQLSALIVTDPNAHYSSSEYRRLRGFGILFAACLSCLVSFLITSDTQSRLIVLLLVIGKTAESCSDLLFGFSQRAERLDRVAQSLMMRGVLTVVAGLCGIMSATAPALVCAAVYSLGRWIVLLLFDVRHAPPDLLDRQRTADSTTRMIGLFVTALPLGIATLLVSLDLHIVRMFIQVHQGERGVGVFSMLTYFLLLGGLVFNAAGQSLSPRLARHVHAGERRQFYYLWHRYLATTVGVSVSVALVVTFWGTDLLNLLFGSAYATAGDALVWLMWGTVLRDISAPFGYAVTSMRCLKLQPVNLLISIAVVSVGCWILIPAKGLLGASQAYCAGMLIKTIGLQLILIHADRTVFNRTNHHLVTLSGSRAA